MTAGADSSPQPTVFERICQALDQKVVAYKVLRHASGAKALVCKIDDRFVLIVLPADRKLSSKLARKALAGKSLRFATKEEVLELTGLAPGSIPPFGSLFNLPTWCDQALADQPQINFNAGDHAISVSMTFTAYQTAEQPTLAGVAE
jgi:Ala-tRNA(Pro) deacylase